MATEQPTLSRFTRTSFLAWALAAALLLALAVAQLDKPFLGFILEPTGYVGATDMSDWPGPKAGLKPLDRVVAIDGTPLARLGDPRDYARTCPVGTPLAYTLADGRTVKVPTAIYRWGDFWRVEFTWWLAAVVHLALGALVLARRPGHPAAEAHWRYCQTFGLFLLGGVAGVVWSPVSIVNYLGAAAILVGILELALVFPARPADPAVERRWRLGGRLAALALVGLVVAGHLNLELFPLAFNMVLAVPAATLMGALGVWAWEAFSPRFEPAVRAQARIVLVGLGLSLVPSEVYALAAMAHQRLPGFEWAFCGFCAFPAAIAYAIVRHRAFDLESLLRRATLYSLLTLAAGAVYMAAAALGHQALGGAAQSASLPGFVAALAVAAALGPLHANLAGWVDRVFLGRRADPMRLAADFGAHVATAEAGALTRELVGVVAEVLGARWVELRAGERVVASAGERPAHAGPVLEASVPGAGPQALHVGPHHDDLAYTRRDAELLPVLAAQVGLGLARAEAFEQRLRLEISQADAAARAEAREALLRQVVHDLGTDLSNISVAVELLRETPDEAAYLDSIALSLARIERFLSEKRARLREADAAEPAPIEAGVALALEMLAPTLAGRHQRVVREGAASGAVPLSEIELAQVLANLLDNASKFSPPHADLRLAIEAADGRVLLRVEDPGPGIPEGFLDALGTRRRADPAVPGDGLGLANVLAIVAPVDGRLVWRNGPAGAIVEVDLPTT